MNRLEKELKSGRPYEVNFGIPDRFANGWHRFVVEIQMKGEVESKVAVIFPADEMGEYPVPETLARRPGMTRERGGKEVVGERRAEMMWKF